KGRGGDATWRPSGRGAGPPARLHRPTLPGLPASRSRPSGRRPRPPLPPEPPVSAPRGRCPWIMRRDGRRGAAGSVEEARHAWDRQFDKKTENTFRSMNDQVGAAFPQVDALEKEGPSDDVLEGFIREGMLGGTDKGGDIVRYARLRLMGSSGDGPIETTPSDE